MTKTILTIKGFAHQTNEYGRQIDNITKIESIFEYKENNERIHFNRHILTSESSIRLDKLAGELSALIDGLKYAAQNDLKDIHVKGSKPILTLIRTGNAGVKKFDKDETYQTAIQTVNAIIERMESRGFSIQA